MGQESVRVLCVLSNPWSSPWLGKVAVRVFPECQIPAGRFGGGGLCGQVGAGRRGSPWPLLLTPAVSVANPGAPLLLKWAVLTDSRGILGVFCYFLWLWWIESGHWKVQCLPELPSEKRKRKWDCRFWWHWCIGLAGTPFLKTSTDSVEILLPQEGYTDITLCGMVSQLQ